MPLVQIHLPSRRSKAYKKAITESIHEALSETFTAPISRFRTISEYAKENFVIDKSFANVKRSGNAVYIVIYIIPHPPAKKKKFFSALIKCLEEKPGIRKEDVLVCLVENPTSNWYFGRGL